MATKKPIPTRRRTAPTTFVEPTAVKVDSRNCFAIYYFASEADAAAYDAIVRKRGDTYNGGWLDGKPCGRDETWDHVDAVHGQLYVVTS